MIKLLAALVITLTLTGCFEDPGITRLKNVATCNEHGPTFGLRVRAFNAGRDSPSISSQTDLFFQIAKMLNPEMPRKPFEALLPFALEQIKPGTSWDDAKVIGKRLCMVYYKEPT